MFRRLLFCSHPHLTVPKSSSSSVSSLIQLTRSSTIGGANKCSSSSSSSIFGSSRFVVSPYILGHCNYYSTQSQLKSSVLSSDDVDNIYAQLNSIVLVDKNIFLESKPETVDYVDSFVMSSTLKKRRKKINKHKLKKRRRKDRYKNKK